MDGEGVCYGDRKGTVGAPEGFSLGRMWLLAPIWALHVTQCFRKANPHAVIQQKTLGEIPSFRRADAHFTFAI